MKRLLILFVVASVFSSVAFTQGLGARAEARKKESEKPQNVAGGVKFQVSKSYQDTYEALLNWVKRADYTIDPQYTNKETGQIMTGIAIAEGKKRGIGTRIMLTLIKYSDTETTIKVVVSEQKRSTFAGTGAWGDAKLNEKET